MTSPSRSTRRTIRAPAGMPIGEAHHKAKLTEALVRELRRLHYDLGLCQTCACKLQGVHPQTGHDAISFITWKHVR